jgi:hypothetical protein
MRNIEIGLVGPAALLVGFFAGVGFAGFAADEHAEGRSSPGLSGTGGMCMMGGT